jgi:hypothetical protein
LAKLAIHRRLEQINVDERNVSALLRHWFPMFPELTAARAVTHATREYAG